MSLQRAPLVAQLVKNAVSKEYLQSRRLWFDPWGGECPLEKGMVAHSSILAWRIPQTEEPGSLHLGRVIKSQT